MIKLDDVSKKVIQLALYTNKIVPDLVSELWIGEENENELKAGLPTDENIESFANDLRTQISELKDARRKEYLISIVDSLVFQINPRSQEVSYREFSEKAFGFSIERVTEIELNELENEIKDIEQELGKDRFAIINENLLPVDSYLTSFQEYVEQVKQKLPSFLTNFEESEFLFEITSNKPWSAFNTHFAPMKSKLILNKDATFSKLDLYRLACHEAFGGHHAEHCSKDKLLVEEGRGEHGLVITFSPQTFVSEAIAEGMYVLLGVLDKENKPLLLGWLYDRLLFALQNLATYLYFDDKLSKEQVKKKIEQYNILPKTVENIVGFSTDKLFGRYAPVYYSAYNFISEVHKKSSKKEELVKDVFNSPTTPKILKEEYL